MSKQQQSPQSSQNVYDVLQPAFAQQAQIEMQLAELEKGEWDRSKKISLRKQLNKLNGMIDEVRKYAEFVTPDIINGMENTATAGDVMLAGKPRPEVIELSQDDQSHDYSSAA